MKIKHVETVSLIDFPNNIASVIFCGGCNFNCDYCFNRGLVQNIDNIPDISPEECLRIINKNRSYIDGIVITGGEPTIQSGLIELIQEIRKYDYSVKLDTNGYNPKVLRDIIDKRMVQYIAMDIKAPLNYYSEVTCVTTDIRRVEESIQLIKSSRIKHEFRSTVWKNHPIQRCPEELIDIISGSDYYIQNFDDKLETDLYYSLSFKEGMEILDKLKGSADKIELRGVWN